MQGEPRGRTEPILVTGTSSGLGQSLLRDLDGVPFQRSASKTDLAQLGKRRFGLIVHCAVDARKELPAVDLPAYVNSNITLTERLLEIPHDCFIYVSSHAVYPADGLAHSEDEALQASDRLSIYGVFKLIAEQFVLRRASRPVILRSSSLVGETCRPNNIMRILRRQDGPVFLHRESPYNLIAYEQVAAFIRHAWRETLSGVFNIGARDWRTLGEIACDLGVKIDFGNYLYTPPIAELKKIQDVCNIFNESSLQVAERLSRQLCMSS